MKNKKIKNLLVLSALLLPSIVLAKGSDSEIPFEFAIFMEAFVSIHMSIFVLLPLANIISPNKKMKTFWTMFAIRVGILLFFDIFITSDIAIFDFILVFIGALIIVPICMGLNRKKGTPTTMNSYHFQEDIAPSKPSTVKCEKCNMEISASNKFCTNCGAELKIEEPVIEPPVTSNNFDPMFDKDEEGLLEEFIEREFDRVNIDKSSPIYTPDFLKKKMIQSIIMSVLLFVYVSLIFFHFPLATYVLGLIIIFIVFISYSKYNFMKYLKKEIKSRPSEKISNIIMSVKESQTKDNKKLLRLLCNIVCIILPLFIFINPRIMYEETNNGYAVRFYTFGLTNFTSAEIPEEYNGKPVVSLRGNTFSNMPLLEEIKLPETITEIRGQAFKNDISLKEVNIPRNLEYLGGGAFYNCQSITKIELPDTLTFLGGESFYNATSLKEVKLSENITEIRGNTFEECSSLERITIPDKVERIGGHAFYNNSSLTEVTFTENSKLKEIGSSAFRLCSKLNTIKIPKGISINERAFKESPTKIKYFGEIDYDSLLDTTKFTYNTSIYLNIGRTDIINRYNYNAIVYNTTICLTEVKYVYNSYQYIFKYTDETGEYVFTLDEDTPYKEVNENLAVRIRDEASVTSYTSGLYVNIYYN